MTCSLLNQRTTIMLLWSHHGFSFGFTHLGIFAHRSGSGIAAHHGTIQSHNSSLD